MRLGILIWENVLGGPNVRGLEKVLINKRVMQQHQSQRCNDKSRGQSGPIGGFEYGGGPGEECSQPAEAGEEGNRFFPRTSRRNAALLSF